MNLIRACIFDLDGVIVDTAHYHFLAWKKLAREIGYELTPADNENLKGVSRKKSLEIVLALGGATASDHEKELMANKKNTWFNDYVERMMPEEIFPGVRQLIRDLRKNGIKVALASSSKNAKTVIKILLIQDDFDAIVDGTMIEHSKPNPEIFLLAAKKLGVSPDECLVFEDAEAGVAAALAAGMKCVGVGDAKRLEKAHEIVARTADFKISELSKL